MRSGATRVNRSLRIIGPHLTFADDAASFPLNRPATTTTATDDTASGNGSGFTFFLVCAVWNCRVFLLLSTSHPTHLTSQQGIHDHPNLAVPAIDTRNFIYKRIPAPFALISNSLAHSRKSTVVLGESSATVPSNTNPYLPPLGLLQSSLTRAEPVADVRG